MSQPATARQRITKTPPPPPGSSMTPPPSSQAPHPTAHNSSAPKDPVRTPTPTHSHLSSPPPTVKAVNALPNSMASQSNQEKIGDLSIEELREKLEEALISCHDAKASAAHAKLQLNLLQFQYSEDVKRKDVELDMVRKEVEVLRNQTPRPNGSLITPVTPHPHPLATLSPDDEQNVILRNRCTALEIENDNLRGQLEDVETHWQEREQELLEENRRLRERIRDNRKHINQIRQANGLPDGTPGSIFTTPRTVGRVTQPPSSAFSTSKSRGDDAFSALLLADQVLSQEANTTPSTPTPHQPRRSLHGHHRGTHSLSSLPTTPLQARSSPQSARRQALYHTPTTTRTPQAPQTAPVSRHRRRESRDSTISASELDDHVNARDDDDVSSAPDLDEVAESRASQEAASLLRKSSSFGRPPTASSSQRSIHVPKTSGLLQSKIVGQVTKPGASKRKPSGSPAASSASPMKKGRSEGIGLGIGGWNGRA